MLKTKNPDFEATIRQKLQGQHFMNHIGFRLTMISEGLIEGETEIREELKQQNGFLHGGATATICDLVTGFAAFSLVEKGMTVVTVEMKVSYLNPGVGEKVWAKGWVLKTGNMLSFCEGEVYAESKGERTLIAKCSATMAHVLIPA
jgi:uncharacterized protein (TIGR00369 family)